MADMFYFMLVPIREMNENGAGMTYRELVKNGTFWLLVVLMITAGCDAVNPFGTAVLGLCFGFAVVLAAEFYPNSCV